MKFNYDEKFILSLICIFNILMVFGMANNNWLMTVGSIQLGNILLTSYLIKKMRLLGD